MDRMRTLARGMSHARAVPILRIDHKVVEYRILQMRGNIPQLEFIKRAIERAFRDTPTLLKKTIWRGWTHQMEQRLQQINRMLNQEITKKLSVIRSGRLSDAQAVVAELAKKWPYCEKIITSLDEARKIQEYVSSVGFHELRAAQDLISLRPDYQKFVAEQKAELERQQEVAKQQALAKQKEAEQLLQQQVTQEQVSNKAVFESVMPQGMQHEIINALDSSTNHAEVAQKLDTKVQDVLLQAELYNCVVHPSLDWRLQSSLNALPQSMNVKDFTFHVATIEHLVHDIQQDFR